MINKPLIFNEKTKLVELFNFSQKIRKKIYNLTIIGESNQVFATAIIKYLLKIKNIQPRKVEEYIRKYMVLFVYAYLRDKYIYFDMYVPQFDDILSRNISLEDLDNNEIKDINLFTSLYIKKDGSHYSENIKKLRDELETWDGFDKKTIEILINILIKDNYYFTFKKTVFHDLKLYNARNFDELIAETINDEEMLLFKIQIDDENLDNFNKNFMQTKSKDDVKKIRKTIFGYMINDAFKNHNLSLDRPVSLIPSKKLKIYLGMKNATAFDKDGNSVMLFVKKDANKKQSVDKSCIIPFVFEFNDQKYKFDNTGIAKI